MEIGGIGRNYSANPAGKDATSNGTAALQDQETKPAFEEYDRLVHGLSKLSEATEKADDDAKARAKQKLKDAQEQLKFLIRWGMNPEIIARQAAQLGVVVAAAAREFTQALAGGGNAGAAAITNTSPAANVTPQDTQQPTPANETAGADEPSSQAEQAYRDVMADRTPEKTNRLSADDIRTAAEFSAIAQQIKALLEKAARDLRQQNNMAAIPGAQDLNAAVSTMTTAVTAAPAPAIIV